ncbi:TDP1 / high mobility group protein [Leishmania donovani]|uniref:HMG (High mobility group) box family protein n=1 Tax=Leishmania donovani TaxID=5661 RepID=A0A504XPA6_LEIDO|nr:HMG (high mobility group) box family protein [Leishmania donovani]CAJ1990557.1 TDP1 / high mobility group protein [Leishmania donovani]VDZ46412.1 high_mobility_group_protein_homolog_tdp-1_putative/GeneDB:LmjF.29.0850 [Leishmania donovani]
MSALPNGSIPADLEKSMLEIMHDVGLSTLSKNTLRRRLEAKYKMDFTPLTAEVDRLVGKLMTTPEIQRELAKIQKEKEDVSARRLKRERSPSSTKKSKKDKESARGKKEKKPDDYPKGALSPYIIFVNENREKLKAKHPDMKNTDLLSEMGNLWKKASEEEKSRYQKLADEDKLRYDREMAAYIARGGAVFKRGGKKAKREKKEKDPQAPKRALTAYFFFASDYRAKHANIPAKQQMSEAGAAWGKMSAEEKKPYEELAAKDKKRYEAECSGRGSKPSQPKAADSASSSSADSSSSDSDETD